MRNTAKHADRLCSRRSGRVRLSLAFHLLTKAPRDALPRRPGVLLLFLACLSWAVEYTVIPTELIPTPDPPVIAVGGDLAIDLRGGRIATLEPDDEYVWGRCYWECWCDCLDGHCNHENKECDINASWFYRARLDDAPWGYNYDSCGYFASGLTPANFRAVPGTHTAHVGAQSCFCLHRVNADGGETCSGPITYLHGGSLSFRVVEIAEINGPGGFSVNHHEHPLDFLSLPLGEAASTATFVAVPFPAGGWPDNWPYWSLHDAGGLLPTQENKRWEAKVATSAAFAGALWAHCGISSVALRLNVVKVAQLTPVQPDAGDWDDGQWTEGHELDDGDDDVHTRVFALPCQRETSLNVRAQPYPPLPGEELPAAWTLTGGEGEDKLTRSIDWTNPGVHPFEASCGVSEKATQVIIYKVDLQVDSNNDGEIAADDDLIETDSPGRLVMVDSGDADGDGIVDNLDFNIGGDPLFTEVKLTISNFPGLEDSRVFLSYDAAAPPETEDGGVPGGGSLRLWKKQSHETRSPLAVKDGGDFVAPLSWSGENNEDGYTAAELGMDVTTATAGGVAIGSGEVTLCLEGVAPASARDISVCVVSNQRFLWMDESFVTGCDSVKVALIAMDIFRDEACTQVLDDWPARNNLSRSPKHILCSQDPICIRVTGPSSGPVDIRVKTETFSAGHVLQLTQEVGTNRWKKCVYLDEQSSNIDGICRLAVVDEELLTVDFPASEAMCTKNVMVDRGEFASCGIQAFYHSATGDRATIRNQAITESKFFDVGDGQFPDNVGGNGDGNNAMAIFIGDVGAHTTDNLEADFLHVASHGTDNGNLFDNQIANRLIFSPSSANLGSDVEWIIVAACSTLNTNGGGRAAWEQTLNSGVRKAHGVLGAYNNLSGDLRGQLESFWNRMQNGAYIRAAYAQAMEFDGDSAQPWAMVYYYDNRFDKLKEMTRDVSSGDIEFNYLDIHVLGVNTRGSGRRAVIDGGRGAVTAPLSEIPTGIELPAFLELQVDHSAAAVKLDFAEETKITANGTVQFCGPFSLDSEPSTLSESQAQALADGFIRKYFPDLHGVAVLSAIGPQKSVSMAPNGKENTVVTGYLLTMDFHCEGIPVLGDSLRLRIQGDEIAYLTIRRHKLVGGTKGKPVKIAEAVKALESSAENFRAALRIADKYEVLACNLFYAEPDSLLSNRDANTNATRRFIPVWRFTLRPQRGQGTSSISYIYVDAHSSRFLGFTKGRE